MKTWAPGRNMSSLMVAQGEMYPRRHMRAKTWRPLYGGVPQPASRTARGRRPFTRVHFIQKRDHLRRSAFQRCLGTPNVNLSDNAPPYQHWIHGVCQNHGSLKMYNLPRPRLLITKVNDSKSYRSGADLRDSTGVRLAIHRQLRQMSYTRTLHYQSQVESALHGLNENNLQNR
jgi:hypothetical protein